MNLKYFMIVICLFLALGLSSAEVQTLGTHKQNSCVRLIQTCGNCTYGNITSAVVYPGSIIVIGETAMVKSGTEYTYNFCNTTELGQYIINGLSNVDGVKTPWAYNFYITTTGFDYWTYLPLFLLLGAFILLIVGVIVKNEYIGLFSGMLFIVSSIYMLVYGFGIIVDMYTRTIGFIALGIGLTVCFSSIMEMFYEDFYGGFSEED